VLDIRRARPSDSDGHDVSLYVSLTNLGLLRTEVGSLNSARRLYGEALELCEKRLKRDPAAVVDLARTLWWMSLCLAKDPDTVDESMG
jgi:hypothetical protein